MKKPIPPSPHDFGVTQRDISTAPDFTTSGPIQTFHGRLSVGLFILSVIAFGLLQEDIWKDWLATIFGGLFFVIPTFFIGTMIASLIICLGLEHGLRFVWPKYSRVWKFRAAEAEYHKAVQRYEAWIARQAEEFWRTLDGLSFERELARLFSQMGFAVEMTPHTSDGGVDIVLEQGGERTVVQCKAHASKVGIGTARELVASMMDYGAEKGVIAALSGVTKPVIRYTNARNIEVLDLEQIVALQRKYG